MNVLELSILRLNKTVKYELYISKFGLFLNKKVIYIFFITYFLENS